MLAILAAVMLAAAPQNDTVYTANGGRLVGTVVEESPQAVTIQLPDGTTRRLSRPDASLLHAGCPETLDVARRTCPRCHEIGTACPSACGALPVFSARSLRIDFRCGFRE